MKLSRALGAILLVGAAALTVRADVVHLKNGQTLEGRVEPGATPDTTTVKTRFGALTIPNKEIESIDTQRTREEELAEREKATDMSSPDALLALARWCRANELQTEALGYEMRAKKRRLEQRMDALKDADAAAIYATAEWALANDYDKEVVDALLKRALLADPESAKARLAVEMRAAQEQLEREKKEAAKLKAEAQAQLADVQRERDKADSERRLAESETEAARRAVRETERERDRIESERRRNEQDRAYLDRAARDMERDRDQLQRSMADVERARADAEAARAAANRLAAECERKLNAYERDRLITVCPRCGWKIVK